MQTVPTAPPKVKAFYCTLYDENGILGKLDGTIYFFGTDGSITAYEPEMAPWTCILGETSVADTQQIMDRLHGGAAMIVCRRPQEVA